MRTAILLVVLTVVAGCRGEPDGARSRTELPEAREAIGEELMLALSMARNRHRKADVLLAGGDVDAAIAEVRRVLEVQFPDGAPEAEDVRLDARARLGKLLLDTKQLDAAEEVVATGLAGATRDSFYAANLFTVKGEILQARADQDEARAPELRRQALEAFDRSLAIGEALQKQLVKEMR